MSGIIIKQPSITANVENRTTSNITKESFRWIIENFSAECNLTENEMKSPMFSSAKNTEAQNNWSCCLKREKSGTALENITLFLVRHYFESTLMNLNLLCEMKIVDSNGEQKNTIPEMKTADLRDQNFLNNDTLTILLEITTVIFTVVQIDNQMAIPEPQLDKKILDLLKKEIYTDIVLVIPDTNVEIKAHKAILSAQSPLFLNTFNHDSIKNGSTNRITINNLDEETLKQMLEFIYTDNKPSRINEYAHGLMAAGELYQLPKLKSMCENILITQINCDNFANLLMHGDDHNSNILKDAVIDFIKRNRITLESDNFKMLESEKPILGFEVFHKLQD